MVGREHEQRTRSSPRFPDQRWREQMKSGERNPPATAPSPISELNERSREIFRLIVDGYVQTGEPIGSRTLSRLLGQHLSPATIRNVMADLEEAGLLYSPHTSAGRLPTEAGLRLFVNGLVENRVIEVPLGLPPAALISAGNYLNARLVGRTIEEARTDIEDEVGSHKAQLDELTSRVVSTGLASWAGGDAESALIVRGQANLLEDVTALADLERLRSLFEMLETKETVLRLLDASKRADGVQIFIGADSHFFGVAGCSVIIAPYQNSREQIVGAIGVIGPTRINYARIIPMVDYTAKMIGRLIG